ncbi:MAG TPA: DUF4384 domain-containing protein [Candidatus Obscuribacterales bacterium]
MKGTKLFALLGSLSLLAVCVPQITLAADAASKPASSAGEKFDEGKASTAPTRQLTTEQILQMESLGSKKPPVGSASSKRADDGNRGIRLDRLFEALKTESHGATPLSHSTVVEHHKAQAAHANGKQPAIAHSPSPKAGGKSEVAIYKHQVKETDNMVAVAHQVISNGSTAVISASLDRPGTVPKYRSGDHMVVNLKAWQDCNVLVFDYDNAGTITQLWPNSFEPNGALTAGQTIQVGGDNSQYTLDIDGKGVEQIFIYAYPSSEKMPGLLTAMAPVQNTPFRSTKMTRAQYHHLLQESREYFQPAAGRTSDRAVTVTARPEARQAAVGEQAAKASFSDAPANKVELTFQIEK